ncbi:hypothetical protein PIB30_047794 [Stylosanthes scabra]|uniref:Uncharacterized protein n=1 Tax=Stylosanthes scabra TaxID=79078 RepID=A0ABU6WFC5_9FABA|nr:hypothetical protein [Stylosanthes scabra]
MEEIQRRTKRRKIEERQNRAKAPRICACYINSSPRLSNSVTLRRARNFKDPRIGVKVHAYAWKAHSSHVPESRLAQLKRDQDFSKPKSATHMSRFPRICVGSKQLTFEAHVGRS